jgi:hypothetical protein
MMQFLSALPAVLGLTGFVVYYFLLRNRGGDRITLDIVGKLRRDAPERLPPHPEKLDPAALSRLIEGDAALRAKVSEQDFVLLRDALRQQFVTSLVVYAICGTIFLAGVGLYAYLSLRPHPVSISSISVESDNPAAKGVPVDLDDLRVRWSATGDPEDVKVSLENVDAARRSQPKTVRSTEGTIVFSPGEYHEILIDRGHGGRNRLRVLFQTAESEFVSPEFAVLVGTTILAVHLEPLRVKIMGTIDNSAIDYYDFKAKLLIWTRKPGRPPEPIAYGGSIPYGRNDVMLDPGVRYSWDTAKLIYLGPDDSRTIRTQMLGF